jgi:hypothetical protein
MQDPKAIKEYADRFLSLLERIANSLEKQPTTDNRPYLVESGKITSFRPLPIPEELQKPMNQAGPGPQLKSADHGITYDQISQAIMRYSDNYGHEAGKALLKEFGATYIKMLKVEDYPRVIEACKVGA